MSTIQKAFVFIVVVLSVLVASVTLVLFAQRVNWSEKATTVEKELASKTGELTKARKELSDVKDAHAAKVMELEASIGALKTELESTQQSLALIRSDKERFEALASELKANYQTLSVNMDQYAQRNRELEAAKELAEKNYQEARAAAMSAEENLAIEQRKGKDYAAQVEGLMQQLASRDDMIKQQQTKISVLESYELPSVPLPESITRKPVYGKVTKLSKDGAIVYFNIGKDDGVAEGTMFIIYKDNSALVAQAKVFDVGADSAAAKIVQPVYGTIAEGDNVTNK